jgi:hypothetical protein
MSVLCRGKKFTLKIKIFLSVEYNKLLRNTSISFHPLGKCDKKLARIRKRKKVIEKL